MSHDSLRTDFPGWRDWFPVRAWERKLKRIGWDLDSLEARDLFARRDGALLFAMLEARGRDPEGKPLMPYMLARGAACVMVPIIKNRDTQEKRFLMILQRRIGSGDLSLEFPAGMVDGEEGPLMTAVREFREETGLDVDAADMVPLWDKELYSSPGLSDESIYFYGLELELDNAAYGALEGGVTGHAEEGEHITTTLKTFAEASGGLTSLQPLLGLLLCQKRFSFPD